MASEYIWLEGDLDWTRTHSPDTKFDELGKWSTQLHPNAESLEKVRDLQAEGVKNMVKKDERGYYVNYSRPAKIKTKKGDLIEMDPVKVIDSEGNPITDMVGNGSKGKVKLEIRSYSLANGTKGKSARLDTIEVTDLVKYGN